jgi:nitrite reductase/ring-hydroxylating ferredoxin subunit
MCPKHEWGFDLYTGRADRGGYRLKIWEVQVRNGGEEGKEEVWVRRKQRIG